ncbi:Protein of unknown function [Clostridium sp. USBA 49]|jgi:hypothetical protein|uniref:DUF1659 domain-containing protein n=1 Tax=Clostridium TaxID=1485 RepID=UPI00099AFAD9|nr:MULTISPECIES: DUF1659 domain-containing protein [Clostridium]SKA78820.1 Protein of unknown function [Clostridium sp. USBA 49]
MAVSTKVQSSMIIKFKTGVDANGEDVFKSTRFSKIKVDSADENILFIGTEIGKLLKYPLSEVIREDLNVVRAE